MMDAIEEDGEFHVAEYHGPTKTRSQKLTVQENALRPTIEDVLRDIGVIRGTPAGSMIPISSTATI
jgi:hypothetical protein